MPARSTVNAVPRKKEPSRPLGKFVPCPGSFIVHPGWVFNEIYKSALNRHFARCSCQGMYFLNWYIEGYGWDLDQVEGPPEEGGWGATVEPHLAPPHRNELVLKKRKKLGKKKNA